MHWTARCTIPDLVNGFQLRQFSRSYLSTCSLCSLLAVWKNVQSWDRTLFLWCTGVLLHAMHRCTSQSGLKNDWKARKSRHFINTKAEVWLHFNTGQQVYQKYYSLVFVPFNSKNSILILQLPRNRSLLHFFILTSCDRFISGLSHIHSE